MLFSVVYKKSTEKQYLYDLASKDFKAISRIKALNSVAHCFLVSLRSERIVDAIFVFFFCFSFSKFFYLTYYIN